VSELPELFDRRVKARSLAYVYTAGALLGLATLAFPHGKEVREVPLFVLAGVAFAIAAVVYARVDRIAEWEIHGAVVGGTLLLTLANYYVGGSALYPILFSWTALYACYFFELRAALAHIALVAIAYGGLLVIQEPMSPIVRWILAVGTPTVAGLLISRLLGRVRAEAVRAADQARALRDSESRTRLILESAHDAFISIDSDGIVTAWNAAAESMLGWPAREALGRPLRELIIPPEGKDEHNHRREALLADPGTSGRRYEVECRRRDGGRFRAELTVSRVKVGEELFLSAFMRDLSDRERREQEREVLTREQAARAEAERVAEMVSGMQLLVDAALAHRRLNDILVDLMPRLRGVLDADVAAVFLAEDGERLTPAGSAGQGNGNRLALAFGEGFAGRVAAERRPMLLHEPGEDDLRDPSLRELGVASLIGVPLLAKGQVTGVIQAAAARGRRFSEEDLGVLRLAGDRVALAIDHARVYEREHRIAETLQRSLLPDRLPQLPGMSVAARYLPAATEAEVGGDWYDVIPIAGGRVGLVMCDVAGKGLGAASMVGRLRSALRAYALEGHDPATVVHRLNRLVWTELGEREMATLVYVELDPADGAARWVNAGHLPPLLAPPAGLPCFLDGGRSVPLGVMPFPTFAEASVEIEPGGTLVLYTDGLVERPGAHIDDGLTRLAEVVQDAPTAPDDLCDDLILRMVPEGAAPDDVALLALRSSPMTDSFEFELPSQPEGLSSLRSLLRRWLRHVRSTDQEIAEITTACGEAATNAIEHAGASGTTPFEVEGHLRDGEVEITVRDNGIWRDPREGEDQGRGLSLMKALMDGVEVRPSPEGTTVRLRRRLKGGGSG
jgi:PAS domain S-box-containing protein